MICARGAVVCPNLNRLRSTRCWYRLRRRLVCRVVARCFVWARCVVCCVFARRLRSCRSPPHISQGIWFVASSLWPPPQSMSCCRHSCVCYSVVFVVALLLCMRASFFFCGARSSSSHSHGSFSGACCPALIVGQPLVGASSPASLLERNVSIASSPLPHVWVCFVQQPSLRCRPTTPFLGCVSSLRCFVIASLMMPTRAYLRPVDYCPGSQLGCVGCVPGQRQGRVAARCPSLPRTASRVFVCAFASARGAARAGVALALQRRWF